MRSKLGKECRKLFRKMMATEFSAYREDNGQMAPQGWYIWTHQHSTNLFFHITLVIHHSRDEFTTEGGWSLDGKPKPYSVHSLKEFMSAPENIRVAFLWSGEDIWWPLVLRPDEYARALLYKDDPIEQCLPLVAPAVWDAGEKLKEHLIPVFEKIIQMHGSKAIGHPPA